MLYLLKVYMIVAFFVLVPLGALYVAGGAALWLSGSIRRLKGAYRSRRFAARQVGIAARA